MLGEMCSTDTGPRALGGSAGPALQRARLQRVDEGVKDTLGMVETMYVQAQKAHVVLLTCPALG